MTDPCHAFGTNSWVPVGTAAFRKAMKPSRLRYMFVNTVDVRTVSRLKLSSVQDCGIISIRGAGTVLPLLCTGLLFMRKTGISSIWCHNTSASSPTVCSLCCK